MKIESEGQDFSKLGMSFKKPKTTYRKEEKIIEHQVEGVLRQNGYYVQKMQSGVMRSFYNGKSYLTKMAASGTPDIMAFKVGELLFVEVKRPGHDATPLQKMKAEELESYGARCFVVHSREEMEEILGEPFNPFDYDFYK